jgi:hypothetical protein
MKSVNNNRPLHDDLHVFMGALERNSPCFSERNTLGVKAIEKKYKFYFQCTFSVGLAIFEMIKQI